MVVEAIKFADKRVNRERLPTRRGADKKERFKHLTWEEKKWREPTGGSFHRVAQSRISLKGNSSKSLKRERGPRTTTQNPSGQSAARTKERQGRETRCEE